MHEDFVRLLVGPNFLNIVYFEKVEKFMSL